MIKQQFIYIARSEDFVKIGISTRPWSRIICLNSGSMLNPCGLRLPTRMVHVIAGDKILEKKLHKRLRAYRIAGTNEWYSPECLLDPSIKRILGSPSSDPDKMIRSTKPVNLSDRRLGPKPGREGRPKIMVPCGWCGESFAIAKLRGHTTVCAKRTACSSNRLPNGVSGLPHST